MFKVSSTWNKLAEMEVGERNEEVTSPTLSEGGREKMKWE